MTQPHKIYDEQITLLAHSFDELDDLFKRVLVLVTKDRGVVRDMLLAMKAAESYLVLSTTRYNLSTAREILRAAITKIEGAIGGS